MTTEEMAHMLRWRAEKHREAGAEGLAVQLEELADRVECGRIEVGSMEEADMVELVEAAQVLWHQEKYAERVAMRARGEDIAVPESWQGMAALLASEAGQH